MISPTLPPPLPVVLLGLLTIAAQLGKEKQKYQLIYDGIVKTGLLILLGILLLTEVEPGTATGILHWDSLARVGQVLSLLVALPLLILTMGASAEQFRCERAVLMANLTMGWLVMSAHHMLVLTATCLLYGGMLIRFAHDLVPSQYVKKAQRCLITVTCSSGVMLILASLVFYLFCGNLQMTVMRSMLSNSANESWLASSLALLLCSLAIWLGWVPGHKWFLDLTPLLSGRSSSWICLLPRVVFSIPLIRILYGLYTDSASTPLQATPWPLLVGVISTATILLGASMAFRQSDVRRLLVFLTIGQGGYITLNLVTISTKSLLAFLVGIGQISITLLILMLILENCQSGKGAGMLLHLQALGHQAPIIGGCISILCFTLVGFPPLPGYPIRFQQLWGLLSTKGTFWLTLVTILHLLMTLAVILRLMGLIWSPIRSKKNDLGKETNSMAVWGTAAAILLGYYGWILATQLDNWLVF